MPNIATLINGIAFGIEVKIVGQDGFQRFCSYDDYQTSFKIFNALCKNELEDNPFSEVMLIEISADEGNCDYKIIYEFKFQNIKNYKESSKVNIKEEI